MKLKQIPNPNGLFSKSKHYQQEMYKQGIALRGHTNNAHNGKVDKNCNACKELIQRQKEAQSADSQKYN
jgi:hypothetical protein